MYNLNPGDVGAVPILDVRRLDSKSVKLLRTVYEEFARDNNLHRAKLDFAIANAFKLPCSLHETLNEAVLELRAASSKIKSFQEQAEVRMSG